MLCGEEHSIKENAMTDAFRIECREYGYIAMLSLCYCYSFYSYCYILNRSKIAIV